MIFKSYEINKINLNINHLILFYGKNEGLKNEALNILIKNKKSDRKILIEATSEYKKTIITKNTASEVTNYKLIANVTFLIKSTNKKINITEEKIINSVDDKFEESRKERAAKQNFARSISNKLISELVID